jgi:tetratricopeptide (TPR) repeat protein
VPDTFAAQADATWKTTRDARRTLLLLEAQLAQQPDDVEALNFAGWLRTTLAGEDFERGVRELRRALELDTRDHRAAVNLAEALGPRGRAQEAVDELRPWCARHPRAHHAHNSLGWLLGVVLKDVEAGLAALKSYEWSPDVQLNLGRLRLAHGPREEAEAHFRRALPGLRPQEAWFRLGEFAAARGHGRRALSALRRTAQLDASGQYQAVAGVQTLGQHLLQHGKYFLDADDDLRWAQAWAQGALLATLPPSFAEVEARARELGDDPELGEDCRAIAACCGSRSLPPRLADRTFTPRLVARGGRAAELAGAWAELQLLLYDELLEREEPLPGEARAWVAVRGALARGAWDEALALLEAQLGGEAPEVVGALAEALGDRLSQPTERPLRERAFALSEAAFARFASWATGGGEGLARMVDVTRLKEKRQATKAKAAEVTTSDDRRRGGPD